MLLPRTSTLLLAAVGAANAFKDAHPLLLLSSDPYAITSASKACTRLSVLTALQSTTEQAAKLQDEDAAQGDEYVDEEKYTTVTVESMGAEANAEDEALKLADLAKAKAAAEAAAAEASAGKKKRIWTKDRPTADGKPKKKKPKFRYETKSERQDTRRKQKNKSKAAKAKREKGE